MIQLVTIYRSDTGLSKEIVRCLNTARRLNYIWFKVDILAAVLPCKLLISLIGYNACNNRRETYACSSCRERHTCKVDSTKVFY